MNAEPVPGVESVSNVGIMYTSKHGVTKQYVDWLVEELPEAIVAPLEKAADSVLDSLETIVIAGPTYMGKISVKPFLEQNFEEIKDKNLVVFTVGCFSPDSKESQKSYEAIPVEIREAIKFFKLPGCLPASGDLNLSERLVTKAVKLPEIPPVSKEQLAPVLESIRS